MAYFTIRRQPNKAIQLWLNEWVPIPLTDKATDKQVREYLQKTFLNDKSQEFEIRSK